MFYVLDDGHKGRTVLLRPILGLGCRVSLLELLLIGVYFVVGRLGSRWTGPRLGH